MASCAGHTLRAADPDRPVTFPKDHAAHPDAQTELWHFHGHATDREGRRYDWFLGFVTQHTDLDSVLGIPVRWFIDPFQVAYLTVADRSRGTFFVRERHNFPDVWVASTDPTRLSLRHGSWSAREDAGDYLLSATSSANGIELRLRPEKPPSLLGDRGYLYVPPRSSNDYYSMQRMTSTGTITIDGQEMPTTGLAWFKHEWGFMVDDQILGFVWFGAQLSSSVELEIGLILDQASNAAEGSFASIREADGRLTQLRIETIGIAEGGETWRSPVTDTVYPVSWRLTIPGRGTLTLNAHVPQQEMIVFPANIWAGSLEVTGSFDGARVEGDAFAEVVGLDAPFGRGLLRTGKPAELPPDPLPRFVAAISSGSSSVEPEPSRPLELTSVEALTSTVAAATIEPTRALFALRCATCHGPSGRGDGVVAASLLPRPRNFEDQKWQSSIPDAQMRMVISRGGSSIGLSPAMPPHADLSPTEVDALVRLIRKWGPDHE
ncbi:MAG: c-type cytochrome [Deltaproteobacteria bacterium]|nr:c-type cytochrome [Deltaproteobacteria bacterium]